MISSLSILTDSLYIEVTKHFHGVESPLGSSCDSTNASSSPSGIQSKPSSSVDSEHNVFDHLQRAPLPAELQECLIGPLGVSDAGWVLPPALEEYRYQLDDRLKGVQFAWNSADALGQDYFAPLTFAGSFGKVQFFCPKLSNARVPNYGKFVAVKHKRLELECGHDMDRELDLHRECSGQHIMPLYTVCVQDMEAWMVMPYAEHTLRTLILEHMDPLEVPSVCAQIAAGMKELHDREVLHRDVKLENILTIHDGSHVKVYIADLGSASGGTRKWSSETFVTTPEYAAPEIWEDGLAPSEHRDSIWQHSSLAATYSEASDIWAVTVIFLQLVLGTLLIPGVLETRALAPFVMYFGVLQLSNAEELIKTIGNVPTPLQLLLCTGLRKHPVDRYGPERVGIQYILRLAMDWVRSSDSALNCPANVASARARVMENFSSTLNEIYARRHMSSRLPSKFTPVDLMSSPRMELAPHMPEGARTHPPNASCDCECSAADVAAESWDIEIGVTSSSPVTKYCAHNCSDQLHFTEPGVHFSLHTMKKDCGFARVLLSPGALV